jgi:hypothetical protein
MIQLGTQPLVLKSSTDEILSLAILWYRARMERLSTNPSDPNENYEFLEGEEERFEWKLAEAVAVGLCEVPVPNPLGY